MDRALANHLEPAVGASPVSIILGPNISTNASTPAPRNQQSSFHSETDRIHRVADGENASSFLRYLRETLRPYVGSTAFTEGRPHDLLERHAVPRSNSVISDLSSEQVYTLLDNYFEATHGLLDLFAADELERLLAQRASLELWGTGEDAASLEVALAIGAQLYEPSADALELSAALFCRGRQLAFESMLGVQSLITVRLFTMLAFYMIGACDRDTASMYLAVAARAATILNLHTKTHESLPEAEIAKRYRIWNSLRNIDVLSSFVFGKPKSTPAVQGSKRQHGEDTSATFNAVVDGCSLLEDAVEQLSDGKLLHVPTAEHLLNNLRSWIHSLPPSLRASLESGSAMQANTLDIPSTGVLNQVHRQAGVLHVSCIYYFAVILITRPFLIAYLLSRLRGRAPDQLIADPSENSDIAIKNSTVSKMAQVCVSAAVYTAQAGRSAHMAGFKFGNLCLLKAWVFGAGLVLGFSKFAGEPRKDIDESFDFICEVLGDIGTMSPQANLYREILETFRESVAKWHKRVQTEVRRAVQSYMVELGVPANDDRPQGNDERTFMHATSTYPLGEAYGGQWNDSWKAFSSPSSTEVLHHLGFGDLSSSYGDDMMLNFEPFERLFYSVE